MTFFRTAFLVFLLGPIGCVSADIRLRGDGLLKDVATSDQPNAGIHHGISSSDGNGSSNGDDEDYENGKFDIAKGVKCHGGFKAGHGIGKGCSGGLEANFSGKLEADDIAAEIVDEFHSSVVSDWVISKDDMLSQWDASELEVGATKTVGVGGFAQVSWGCKVTFEKDDDGQVHKTAQCGGKLAQAMGKIGKDDDVTDMPQTFHFEF